MEAEQFVQRLRACAPTLAALEAVGLSLSEAADFVRRFECLERETAQLQSSRDELISLLTMWDLGNVEIGMIRFLSAPLALADGWQLGFVEVHALLLLNTGEIIVREDSSRDHCLWHVAEGSAAFLDALPVAAEFLSNCATGRVAPFDFDAAGAVAEACSTLAGGERYKPFYLMLLGAE